MALSRPCSEFRRAYLDQLSAGHPHRAMTPDAYAFGGGGALADRLAELVLSGKKRATTSLPIEFASEGEALPVAGSLSVILDSRSHPVAIIERTKVESVPFEDVDGDYAATEGEGDGSLAYWRQAHREYFLDVCRRLGGTFEPRMLVVCQVFRVVWPHA